MAQIVKNLPVLRDTQLRFLGWEDPLEKEMATHSSILAWRIPWTEVKCVFVLLFVGRGHLSEMRREGVASGDGQRPGPDRE